MMFTQIFEGLQCARHSSGLERYIGEQDWKKFLSFYCRRQTINRL